MELSDSHEWVLWQGREAVGEPHFKPVVASAKVTPPFERKRRKRHWAGSFQLKFSRWLKGDGERPCNLGYTRRELMRHLERQFSRGMTWDNYAGRRAFKSQDVWVVDHIVPKSLFDEDSVSSAYALTNLRPLWIKQNMIKGMVREHLI